LKRQARLAGNLYVEPEAKLGLVVRIRGYVSCLENVFFFFSLLLCFYFLIFDCNILLEMIFLKKNITKLNLKKKVLME